MTDDLTIDENIVIFYMSNSIGKRLEQYTAKRPQEVLIVNAEIAGKEDQIVIFKGYSSSLMHSTVSDTDLPVFPDDAKIISIDRVTSPYNPESCNYIQRGVTGQAIESLLLEVDV